MFITDTMQYGYERASWIFSQIRYTDELAILAESWSNLESSGCLPFLLTLGIVFVLAFVLHPVPSKKCKAPEASEAKVWERQIQRPASFVSELSRTGESLEHILAFHEEVSASASHKASVVHRETSPQPSRDGFFDSLFACCVYRDDEDKSKNLKDKASITSVTARTASASDAEGAAEPKATSSSTIDSNPEEVALVAELKASLSDILETDCGSTTVANYGGEPSCFRRFLRARAGNVRHAGEMFRDTVAWRQEEGVNGILENPVALKVRQRVRPFWSGASCGFSRDGNPVFFFKLRHFLPMYKRASEEDLRMFYICWMENALKKQREGALHGAHRAATMPSCIEVYDFEGLGMSAIQCTGGFAILNRILSIGQKYYPENLHRSFFLNVPSIFELGWRLVRGVLHERTHQKISISKDECRDALAECLGRPEDVTRMLMSISKDCAPDGSLCFKEEN